MAPAVASPQMSVRASGCGAQAAQLAAGKIRSYNCAVVRPSGVTASAAWPSQCSTGTGTLTGWLAVSRRAACEHTQFGIVIVQHPSEKVVGTTNMHAVNTMTASTAGARWSSTSDLWVFGFTGVEFPNSTRGLLFGTGIGTGDTWKELADGASWRGTGNIDQTLAPGKIQKVTGFWEMTLSGTGWGNSVTVTLNLAPSRCDNAFTGRPAGCVFPGVYGIAGIGQAAAPQYAQHVYGAQLSGLPGRLGTGTYLNRLQDPVLKGKNYTKACPTSIRRPAGLQCDEYPFQSTKQGAYTSGATQARSLPWCKMPDPKRSGPSGWSRCFILPHDNLSGGGQLGGFYNAERMLDGDPFEVGYLP